MTFWQAVAVTLQALGIAVVGLAAMALIALAYVKWVGRTPIRKG